MKLVTRLCFSHSRASIGLVNGGPRPSSAQLSSLRSFSLSSKPLSECGFCRTVHHKKIYSRNNDTMCNSCVARFHTVHSSPTSLSTFSAPMLVSSSKSLVIRSPSSITLASEVSHSNVPQLSEEWFALRRDRLTTSVFSTALGFWRGNRRFELWSEKVFSPDQPRVFDDRATLAMNWGISNESTAIGRYKSITGREVNPLGFALHTEEDLGWLGASPDGILSCFELGGGILEVKCPYNKGNPEKALPWTKMPFYYMPQVQGLMEIMDRDWVDLYCWTVNGSTVFRVCRDRHYWDLIHGILREFWWENVVPAREVLALGKEDVEVNSYQPSSTHKMTGLAIAKSAVLSREAKILCREIAGHVEFFV